MIPVSPGAEMISAIRQETPGLWLSLLLLLLVLLALSFICFPVSQRRHRRYQRQASRVLVRLPQLRDDAARLVYLRKINPYVFEEMLLTAFARQGYRIKRNVRYSGDGGIDGQVWINGQRWLIQAKRFSSCIQSGHVRDFGELVRQEKCRGFFVHTGRTGEVSREALSAVPDITLISGGRLLTLLAGDAGWQTRGR
ncbi:restriction endonuclease [Pectobacteriaceae bacterium CE70]|uniref:Restriction endonuclease n=1 Tax=Serratia sp. (strain ATCC 39006) TaxID=104623 RepID=A0A2I5TNS2_SERS3|nr:restriction endonuclease [Serratia sp. ATCC 39006]WJV63483.1 restriction endonuclease [Pectobacteriaceae bacterium C52]WJV67865.1 restriction endonuclease [Pectobacteriaceae bacterium CE70]WJY11808.1 restriction endonuclease [Pectobacteriaceae bacterium C80]AUH01890.1 restriction endonuclease [Serratia sp. ATCC 39006]AUH06212.1 restriction endonuclease [Serratia sp. ATCC 39006]